MTQPATSSQFELATNDDIYAQVFGKDRPGRIRGAGTGIHPKKVMIYPTCSTHSHLRDENVRLTQQMKVLADKIKDVELLVRERNANQAPSSSKCVASSVSVMEPTSVKLQGKNVKMLNIDGEEVGIGVVMSEEKEKMVMGRFLEDAYCEIFVTFATKADAALFVKDIERTKMKDAVDSHIIWFKDYIQVDPHL